MDEKAIATVIVDTLVERHTHWVKAREKGRKTWYFVTPGLGLNRLRIHAALFTAEGAEKSATEWAKQDDQYEFKAVRIGK